MNEVNMPEMSGCNKEGGIQNHRESKQQFPFTCAVLGLGTDRSENWYGGRGYHDTMGWASLLRP